MYQLSTSIYHHSPPKSVTVYRIVRSTLEMLVLIAFAESCPRCKTGQRNVLSYMSSVCQRIVDAQMRATILERACAHDSADVLFGLKVAWHCSQGAHNGRRRAWDARVQIRKTINFGLRPEVALLNATASFRKCNPVAQWIRHQSILCASSAS